MACKQSGTRCCKHLLDQPGHQLATPHRPQASKRRIPLAEVLQDRGVDIATEELKMFEDFDTDLDAESCQGTSGRHRGINLRFAFFRC